MEQNERLMTRAEVAKVLRLNSMTILRWEEQGKLKRVPLPSSRTVRYRKEDVERLMGEEQAAP